MEIPALNLIWLRRWMSFLAAITMVLSCAPRSGIAAQASSTIPAEQPSPRATPRVFEDDNVKIVIPPGWTIAEPASAAQPFLRGGRSLQLMKNGYTLTLAYKTEPTAARALDRFAEIFAIPWLDPGRTENCGFSLRRNQQPVSATLLFIGFLMDTADARVRGNCAIQNDVGVRWFTGFFTVQNGGYFLRSNGPGCAAEYKVYTLASPAKTADPLPTPDDPALKAIISDAGRIVTTIQYKRCPLAPGRNSTLN